MKDATKLVFQSGDQIRMTRLAESFPALAGKPGVFPWDPDELDGWASSVASSGERHAAAFVLGVWNKYAEFKVGRFDLHKSMACWDPGNLRALVAWIQAPFFP